MRFAYVMLSKCFILNDMEREKIIIRTSIIGIIGNILLVAAKAFIGILVGSIAIVVDAVNNLTDALSSTITIIGTKLSNKKPDKKHPLGHGRIEYVTSAIIAVIILSAGIIAIYESIMSLINKNVAEYTYVTIIIVSIAILVKIALGIYFTYVGKKVHSEALKASGKDALFDALLSFGTLVSVIVMMIWKVSIEGYVGIVIGLFIIKGGIGVMAESISSIIGRRVDKETALGVKSIVLSFEDVKGAYDLIINDYGVNKATGSIHIEVNDDMKAKDIHALSRKIAEAVYLKYHIILTVGVYASNEYNDEISAIRHDIKEILKNYPDVIQMHGFYVDTEIKSVSFDIIISFDEKNPNDIRNRIFMDISSLHPDYDYFIVIDQDITD